MNFKTTFAIIAALFIAGCQSKGEAVMRAEKNADAEAIVKRAIELQRSGRTSLTVMQDSGGPAPLLRLSWSMNDFDGKLKWDEGDDLLEKAQLDILSDNGMPPFYAYCFGQANHAEQATKFCTRTLIEAMKSYNIKKRTS